MTDAGFQVEPSSLAELRAALHRAAEQVGRAVALAREANMREPAMGDGASQEFRRRLSGALDEQLAQLGAHREQLDRAGAELERTLRAYDRQDAAGAGQLNVRPGA